MKDRVVASKMGYFAVELIKEGIGNRIVATKGDDIVDYDILEGLNMSKKLDAELLKISEILSM